MILPLGRGGQPFDSTRTSATPVSRTALLVLLFTAGFASIARATVLYAHIPAFARQYRTSCSTCHTAAPKLNVLGEAFRLNGYRLPENALLLRREGAIPLGQPEWRELWPRGIWPGELPAIPPLSLRIELDLEQRTDGAPGPAWTWEFPHELYLLSGANLGGSIAVFAEATWSQDDGVEVVQAQVKFQDPVPYAPPRLLNLWVGLQNAYLFALADRQTDSPGRRRFAWQDFSFDAVEFPGPLTAPSRSAVTFTFAKTRPTVELNGLPRPWVYYAVGAVQEPTSGGDTAVVRSGWYYKLRVKLGGLRLDGTYGGGASPPPAGYGQLLDRSITVEHFRYFGSARVPEAATARHDMTGIAVRVLVTRLDLGGGYVRSHGRRTWEGIAGEASHSAFFVRGEYLVFPWLLPYVRAEKGRLILPGDAPSPVWRSEPATRDRLAPGVAVLLRQNVRAVAEMEITGARTLTGDAGASRGSTLGLRLDLSF